MKLNVLIEIPKGSRNKYEIDKETGRIAFDRLLASPMHYPCDYGFVPDTLCLDGDPLDALVLMWEPTFPGCQILVKPIGVMKMEDGGSDEKLLCVPVKDPLWNHVNELHEAPPHLLKEIEHFFKVYKDLENKKVEVNGWENREFAEKVIAESYERYKATAK